MSEAGLEFPLDDRTVELRVAPRLENLAVVRTLVDAVGTFEDLDIDTVADLRLAVDEMCTQLVRSASVDATLVVVVDPRDAEVVVRASAGCESDDAFGPDTFSWHVLTALTDEAETFHDGRGVFGVALTTRRVGAAK